MGEHEPASCSRDARGPEGEGGDDRAHPPGDDELRLQVGDQPPQLQGVAGEVSRRPRPNADAASCREPALPDRDHPHTGGARCVGERSRRTGERAVLQGRGDVEQDVLGAAGR